MPSNDDYDDEAVARLLAEEAKASSSLYASRGLAALLPRRTNAGGLKPNTQFLKNLVRDADSHNAALKRKEEQDRRERLRKLEKRRHRDDAAERDSDQWKDGNRERKRLRLHGSEDGSEHEYRRRKAEALSRRHQRRTTDSEKPSTRSRSRSHDRHSQKRHRHAGRDRPTVHDPRQPSHRTHHRRRSRSASQPQRGSPELSQAQSDHSNRKSHTRPSPDPSSASSDPLEELVGPLPAKKTETSPPVRSRGRGAHKQSGSVMDSHFSAGYDPALDVHLDSEDSAEREDWDMALEALRDRQQWKRKHADRMREAGFADDEIKKWEDSGKEKSSIDLKWRKAGEGREWDVGKSSPVQDEAIGRLSRTADSELEASWKRRSGGLLKDLKRAL